MNKILTRRVGENELSGRSPRAPHLKGVQGLGLEEVRAPDAERTRTTQRRVQKVRTSRHKADQPSHAATAGRAARQPAARPSIPHASEVNKR